MSALTAQNVKPFPKELVLLQKVKDLRAAAKNGLQRLVKLQIDIESLAAEPSSWYSHMTGKVHF
jgi:hypothetical protein